MKASMKPCVAVLASAAVWFTGPSAAVACERCFGAGIDTPTTRGIAVAMLLLIGTTGVVWSGIGAFFLHLRRRTRMLEPGDLVVTEVGDIRENDHRGLTKQG